MLDDGKLICNDTPIKTAEFMLNTNHIMRFSLPICTQLCSTLNLSTKPVLSKSEAIDILEKKYTKKETSKPTTPEKHEKAFSMKDLFFRYDKNGIDILSDLMLIGYRGEILSVIGGNGSGKTTLLSVLSGNLKPYRGKIVAKNERIALLPQNPRSLFIKPIVKEDILYTAGIWKKTESDVSELVNTFSFFSDIPSMYDKNPLDLSGGEMQRLAFFKVMLINPTVILLDEPSKGLDVSAKKNLAQILIHLKKSGISIVLVTHDLEFSALCSDRCAMLFNGEIISCETPSKFFSTNSYYTTEANKLVKNIFPDAVTLEEALKLCRG
jgi:energy-coupling factor transport system ATP-binding protein